MLYLALSCLQGHPALDAALELSVIAPGHAGLQLTPGCYPTELSPQTIPVPQRTHHGYVPDAYNSQVWSTEGELLWHGHSVHPPLRKNLRIPSQWRKPEPGACVLETMYPGYVWLSAGIEIDNAMNEGYELAVDIAHLAIMRRLDILGDGTLRRIFAYGRIAEIHVSRSVGKSDSHRPLMHDYPGADRDPNDVLGLAWAIERFKDGVPVIYETYIHKLSQQERQDQVGIILC